MAMKICIHMSNYWQTFDQNNAPVVQRKHPGFGKRKINICTVPLGANGRVVATDLDICTFVFSYFLRKKF